MQSNQVKNVFLIVCLFISACKTTEVKLIGNVNMISNRNVNPNMNYKLISSYSGGSKKELKESRSLSIEDAIEKTVRKIPGGEFLVNAKVYQIAGKYYAAEGDVWGEKASELSYRGFKVGDKVIFKDKSLLKKFDLKADYGYGEIVSLKDDKTCYVKLEDNDRTVELSYDRISKR